MKQKLTVLLFLFGLLGSGCFMAAEQLPASGDQGFAVTKTNTHVAQTLSAKLGKTKLKKFIVSMIILGLLGGMVLFYLLIQKKEEPDDVPSIEELAKKEDVSNKQGDLQDSLKDQSISHEKKNDSGDQSKNTDTNSDKLQDMPPQNGNIQQEEEEKQRKERVKELQEKFLKEGESIGQYFPYLFEHFKELEYDGEIYYQKDVSKNGNCWAYTGWLTYLHVLNQCEEAYTGFPNVLEGLCSDAKNIKNTYQKWINNLNQALQDLKDPIKREPYLYVYWSMSNFYKSMTKNWSGNLNMWASIRAETAPYEAQSELIWGERYEQLTKDIDKEKVSTVIKLVKQPGPNHISWFPAMHKTKSEEFIETKGELMKSIIQNIDESLNKDDKSAIEYISNHIVGAYLEKAEQVANSAQELIDLIPLLTAILQEGHQYGDSLQKQLLWLQEKPEKLALLLRFIRLCEFVFSKDANSAFFLTTDFDKHLKNGTYGSMGYFRRLGIDLQELEKIVGIDHTPCSVYYTKGDQKMLIKGLIVIDAPIHVSYAVSKKVWEGSQQ